MKKTQQIEMVITAEKDVLYRHHITRHVFDEYYAGSPLEMETVRVLGDNAQLVYALLNDEDFQACLSPIYREKASVAAARALAKFTTKQEA